MKKCEWLRPKVGLFMTVLLEDEYNYTAGMRPAIAQCVARVAGTLRARGDVVELPFAEIEESDRMA